MEDLVESSVELGESFLDQVFQDTLIADRPFQVDREIVDRKLLDDGGEDCPALKQRLNSVKTAVSSVQTAL